MDIEELVVVYKTEKNWVSGRLATIDNLLDREAYGNSSYKDELNKEYDELEKRMEELRHVGDLIGRVNELNRLISLLEDNIDNLACFIGNTLKIENLYKEIEDMEAKKDAIQEEIANILKIEQETKEEKNKR